MKNKIMEVVEILDEIVRKRAPMTPTMMVKLVNEKCEVSRSTVYNAIKKMGLVKVRLPMERGRSMVAYARKPMAKMEKIRGVYCWVAEDAFTGKDPMEFFKYVFIGPTTKYSVFVAPCSYSSCCRCGPGRNSCYGASNCPHPVFRNYGSCLETGEMIAIVYV